MADGNGTLEKSSAMSFPRVRGPKAQGDNTVPQNLPADRLKGIGI